MNKKKVFITIIAVLLLLLMFSGIQVYRVHSMIQDIFRLNAVLQTEGYYMGELEFRMLGLGYYLDKGHYFTALSKLSRLHTQLQTRKGLIKVPEFQNKQEELEFYLSLQNPRTGAFMDDSYPVFTFFAPTDNMIKHLDELARDAGKPLKLKYPIRFPDSFNTPEKLKAYLDDISTVGWLGALLPKTSYIEIAELSYYEDLEKRNLYSFSPEWKHAFLQWLYDNQDSKTGFWGPRMRKNGELLNSGDLGPTFHILKVFVNNSGENIHPEFPIRHADELIGTALKKLSAPMPEDANLSEIHDWSLTRTQGISMLTDYLWKSISAERKADSRKYMEEIVRNRFQKFYVPEQGSFSLYPEQKEGTLDGTGCAIEILKRSGAMDQNKQARLWGTPETTARDFGVRTVQDFKQEYVDEIRSFPEINSIRMYSKNPDFKNPADGLVCINYPQKTAVPDIMDLCPRVAKWTDATPQRMGNWISKESILEKLAAFRFNAVPVMEGDLPEGLVNQALKNSGGVTIIGFDLLQVPRCRLKLILK